MSAVTAPGFGGNRTGPGEGGAAIAAADVAMAASTRPAVRSFLIIFASPFFALLYCGAALCARLRPTPTLFGRYEDAVSIGDTGLAVARQEHRAVHVDDIAAL